MGSRLEANSTNVRKRIEKHTFDDEDGEEYEGSKFGGFPEYFRRKKLKLQNLDAELRSQSSQNPPIFRGVVAHINGYTQPSLNDLHNLIVSHGGGFLQYLDSKTVATHVIASNLTPKKKVEFASYRIVKPAWVVESVKAGRLLPWDAYRVVGGGESQKILGFDGGRVVSQTDTQRSSYREQTEGSWYASQVRKYAEEGATPIFERDNPESRTGSIKLIPGEPTQTPLPADTQAAAGGLVDSTLSSTQRDLSFLAHEIDEEVAAKEEAQDVVENEPQDENKHLASAVAGIHRDPTNEGFGSPDDDAQCVSESDTHGRPPLDSAQRRATDESTDSAPAKIVSEAHSPQVLPATSPDKSRLTAEEHNARLLSDPHLAKSSTANPDFLNQYYRESRLHHLSTWKADLKAQLQSVTNEQTLSRKDRQKRPPGARRYIMHVDFDSFFAAVSLRNHPELVDTPVVIAHGSGPGSEIASCNYPARTFGVKNGMWMKSALTLCPNLKVLPYDYKAYEDASRRFYKAIMATDCIVQSVSIDEALVDITNPCIAAGGSHDKVQLEASLNREQSRADEIASDLRDLIKKETGCDASIGIGNNILLAKVALRKAKPAGQHQIKPEEVVEFLGELTVQELPGVAHSLGGKLEEIGVRYVKDIRNLTKERLSSALGPKTGERLWDYSRGIDKTEVGEQVVRKSVSAEVNWGIRFVTQQQADEFVQCLCDELSQRLLEQGFKGKQLTMKIMRRAADAPLDPPKNLGHGKCDTFNKSVVLGVPTNDRAVLGREALSILKGFGFSPGELRGLGVQMQKLEPLKPSGKPTSPSIESSQKRLQFKMSASGPSQNTRTRSAPARSSSSAPSTMQKLSKKIEDHPDPIERSPTPEEKSGPEPIKGALMVSRLGVADDTYKPLNITGTQFVLPTQIDPSVLAELPPDIRSKFAPKQLEMLDNLDPRYSPSPRRSRGQSPFPSASDLPNQSQIDPETLNALPEDVRNELLSYYQSESSKPTARQQQQLLPQSPRKPRPALAAKKQNLTPSKKKTSTLLGRGRPSRQATRSHDNSTTLTQSNFVARPPTSQKPRATSTTTDASSYAPTVPDLAAGGSSEISESFLSALPPDLRAELLAEQKRDRLRSQSGLDVSSARKRPSVLAKAVDGGGADGAQRILVLPPREPMPTFTSRKLSSIEELRAAMSGWVEEFSAPIKTGDEEGEEEEEDDDDDDEGQYVDGGPHDEDVSALATYLGKVVTVERNMDKAVSVVKWLGWLVSELPGEGQRRLWAGVLERVRRVVEEAVRERSGGGAKTKIEWT